MHIVLFVDTAHPEVTALAIRTLEHARYWVAANHQVTVVTGVPNAPTGNIFKGYRHKLWQSEMIDGIRFIRVCSYITANKGALKRIADYVSLALTSFVAGFFIKKPDVIIASSPQPFIAMSTWALAKLRRRPFVFELRDLWPESITAVDALRPSRMLRFFGRCMHFIYRHSLHIVPNTDSFKAYLLAHGIDETKISVIKNGFDLSSLHNKTLDANIRAKLGLPQDKILAGYIGTHGMAHALETLLQAAKILQHNPRVHLVLMGNGAERDKLQALALELALTNVTLLPGGDHLRALSLLNACDICLIHLNKSSVFKTVIPSKIFEAMALAKPIIAGLQGESAQLIEQAGAGCVVMPEDATALAAQLLRLTEDGKLRAQMGAAGKQAVSQDFDRQVLAKRYLGVLAKVVAGAPSPTKLG